MDAAALAKDFDKIVKQYDVIITPTWWQILDAAKAGSLVDLSPFINEKDYMNGVLDRVKVNGKIYALPGPGYPILFFYKKSVFSKYNLNVPQTISDFNNLLNQLVNIKGNNKVIVLDFGFGRGYPSAILIDALIANLGGHQMHADIAWGRIRFSNAASQLDLSNILQNIVNHTQLMNVTLAYSAFWNETYYLTLRPNCAPAWLINFGRVPADQVINDLGTFAFPGTGNEKVAPTEDISYAVVSASSAHRNEALEFTKFYSTRGAEIMAAEERLEGIIPMYKNANINEIWAPARTVFNYIKDNNVYITFTIIDDTFTIPQVGVHWIGAFNVFTNPNLIDSYVANMTAIQPYYPVKITPTMKFFNWAIPSATAELYEMYRSAFKESK